MTRSITERQLALFAALAISVHIVEAGIPSPLPGVKPGLANAVTLIVLLRYGLAAAAWVSLLRVIGGSLLLGTFLGPTFVLSLGGALGALVTLALGERFAGGMLGPVGHACLAALAHTGAQLLIARGLFIPHDGLWTLAPALLAFALTAGVLTGIIAAAILGQLERNDDHGRTDDIGEHDHPP